MQQHKSKLNKLLLVLDNKPSLDATAFALTAIAELLKDETFEVNRDLFDGVSNELRLLVIAGFTTYIVAALAAGPDKAYAALRGVVEGALAEHQKGLADVLGSLDPKTTGRN